MNMKRTLSFLISLCLLVSAMLGMVSCGISGENNDSESSNVSQEAGTDGETAYDPNIPVTDYDCEFNVVIGGTFDSKYYFLEEGEGDAMSDAVYERQIKIKDHLGVEFFHQNGGGWIEYAATIQRGVMSGGDDYQMVMTHVYQGVTTLITDNSLYDISELPDVNLDAPWWHTDLMEEIKIGDRYLLGYNDFCLSQVNTISFNKKLLEDFRLENPYDLVRNKQWTLDKFVSMASQVSINEGDPSWGSEDTYGLTGWGWVPLIDFVTSSNLKIVDRDAEGNFYVAYEDNSEKVLDLIDTVTQMYNADWSKMWPSVYTDSDVVSMASGHTLFHFANSQALIQLKGEEVDFGILPYPLYDEQQENYRTLNWNGLMGIPASIKNPEMVGAVLEMLNYYSAPVKDAFYENLLGSKVAQSPDDVDMLNIIWETVVSDVGIVACNSSTAMDNLVYMLPKMCESGNNNFASYMKSNKRSAQRGLDRIFLESD